MRKSLFKYIPWQKKLKAEAIPTINLGETEDDLEDIGPEFNNSHEMMLCEDLATPFCANCGKQMQQANFYRRKYNKLLVKYKKCKAALKLRGRMKTYVKKQSHKDLECSINSLQNISAESKTFCKLLLSSHQKKYSADVRYLVQNIFYKSQTTYLFLRNKLNLNLPHVSTINRWAPIKFLQPGFKNSAFEAIRKKCAKLSDRDAKHMVLMMDEMSIKKELRYNSHLDLIDGFESTGFARTDKIGTHVCVFMLKALFSNWNIVLNYFISHNGLSADTLTEIVKENITMLENIGIKICVLVCDQSSTNRKCFSNFGISAEKPFFEVNGQKVFFMYDFPHLIKSLRNGWMKCDLKTPDGNASFQVIKELYEMESNAKTKMCPKLTRQHIFPNSFEKMRVKFATQLFSRTVAAAIRTMVETLAFKTSSTELAMSTANFIEKIDKIFDCFNSGSLYADNCYRSAVQVNNESHRFIQTFLEYLERVEFVDEKKRVFFLSGMKLTLNSFLLFLKETLKEGSDVYFITTKSLNQDKLENTFSILRQKGGNNNNPSVAELNNILAKLMVSKIVQSSSSSNCESKKDDTMEIIEMEIDTDFEEVEMSSEHNVLIPNEACDVEFEDHIYADYFLEDAFDNSSLINVELVSMRYFVGYVAFKVIPKLQCDKCCKQFKKVDEVLTAPSELFIFFKNYQRLKDFGNLVAPSDILMDVCKKHIIVFHKIFKNEPQRVGIKSYVIESCKRSTPEWFDDNCLSHRLEILDFLLLVLLRKHCTWSVEKGSSKQRKVRIVSNE